MSEHSMAPNKSWKTQFNYPLVCLSNAAFEQNVFVYSMLERNLGGKDKVAGLLKFSVPGTHKILAAAPQSRHGNKHSPMMNLLLIDK